MSEFTVSDYLDHMEQAANEANGFLGDRSRAEFDADRRTQYAVIMALVIVGEAASRMSEKYPQFIAETKHIPWREIRGMRNHAVHVYFDIDLDIIWDSVVKELPKLRQQIAAVRQDLSTLD